jgi:hypothetical protein
VVCVCGTGRTTPTLVGGRTAAGQCKTGPRPLPQAALNETSSISVIFIYLYCEIHIFNYFSICLLTTPFELLQNHLTRVQRGRRDPTHVRMQGNMQYVFHIQIITYFYGWCIVLEALGPWCLPDKKLVVPREKLERQMLFFSPLMTTVEVVYLKNYTYLPQTYQYFRRTK